MNDEATRELLERLVRGDAQASEELLQRHRTRLRRMVALRLDGRLDARVDASDIVQEALLDAAQGLADYARTQPVPFYPWLRRLAWEKVVDVQRRHVDARRRSIEREEARLAALPDHSSVQLAERLLAGGLSPAESLVRRERLARVRTALGRLPDTYHEVLVLRYLEQLDTLETAAVLGVSEGVVKGRHRRALERLQLELDPAEDE
jgi:RNA polymerase sigma-70 factor (ECF subfamily)